MGHKVPTASAERAGKGRGGPWLPRPVGGKNHAHRPTTLGVVDEPELWRWIWLLGAGLGVGGEMLAAGTFFLLPFGLGAAVACVLAFLDIGLAWQWIAFVGVSAAAVAATRPLARRLDEGAPTAGIGAQRWMGELATVLEDIPEGSHETGLVRVGRQEWRAESRDGTPLAAGSVARVIDVIGTRLVVWPADELSPAPPPVDDPSLGAPGHEPPINESDTP